jgi:hypothetical protein
MKNARNRILVLLLAHAMLACAGGKSGGNGGGESQPQEDGTDGKTDGTTDAPDGGGPQAGSIAITGNFDNAAAADVDHVVAVPVYGGQTRDGGFESSSAKPVESGQVAITVTSGSGLHLNDGGGESGGEQQGEGGGPGGPADSHVIVAF